VVAGVAVKHEGVAEYGEAGDGGVGVDDVKGGVGEVGGAEIVVELVTAGGSLDPGGDETELVEGEVAEAGVGSEAGREHPGNEASRDGEAGEGAGGGGIGGEGGKFLGLLVGLDLSVEGFGGGAAAVGGGGVVAVDLL